MMTLENIRDYVATLGIAEDEHCYCGKMPGKKERSIGVYPLKNRAPCSIPLGGLENASYETKGISILVHWNRIPGESEVAAARLRQKLLSCREEHVGEHTIKFISVAYEEPIPVDTDDDGIYEYAIECLFYYER